MKKQIQDKKWTKEFAVRLQSTMNEMGVDSYNLSKMTGLTYQCIDRLLEGDTTPLATTIVKLANALGVNAGYFVEIDM